MDTLEKINGFMEAIEWLLNVEVQERLPHLSKEQLDDLARTLRQLEAQSCAFGFWVWRLLSIDQEVVE